MNSAGSMRTRTSTARCDTPDEGVAGHGGHRGAGRRLRRGATGTGPTGTGPAVTGPAGTGQPGRHRIRAVHTHQAPGLPATPRRSRPQPGGPGHPGAPAHRGSRHRRPPDGGGRADRRQGHRPHGRRADRSRSPPRRVPQGGCADPGRAEHPATCPGEPGLTPTRPREPANVTRANGGGPRIRSGMGRLSRLRRRSWSFISPLLEADDRAAAEWTGRAVVARRRPGHGSPGPPSKHVAIRQASRCPPTGTGAGSVGGGQRDHMVDFGRHGIRPGFAESPGCAARWKGAPAVGRGIDSLGPEPGTGSDGSVQSSATSAGEAAAIAVASGRSGGQLNDSLDQCLPLSVDVDMVGAMLAQTEWPDTVSAASGATPATGSTWWCRPGSGRAGPGRGHRWTRFGRGEHHPVRRGHRDDLAGQGNLVPLARRRRWWPTGRG